MVAVFEYDATFLVPVAYNNLQNLVLCQISCTKTVVLKVGMSCQGCAGAVNRVLGKMEGVESFDIDLKEQKVTVKGNVQPDEVLQAVSKTGKKTAFWVDEAPPENKPKETAPAASAENDNKPSETAPVASENKPSETEIVTSAEPENKPSETAIETDA
ncbi:unnamed protein product [Sphenostylis stenocarpa]|uniref:HMA domain-containing protein n=1 Tax=Sphenostylis stenocarpa TaxID=92480 RepID=A0AA86SV74_9FABA|nr:unnamed protein product [Sphenostylis stenocarpa]